MAARRLLTCKRCGMQFYYAGTSKTLNTCFVCVPKLSNGSYPGRSEGDVVYDMTLKLVTYRIAFEMIEPLLKMGRVKEAKDVHLDTEKVLSILRAVEAPARSNSQQKKKIA